MPSLIVPPFTECKQALFSIANHPEGDSRLDEMRLLFLTMHRIAATDDDALEIVVVSEDCLWRSARAGNTRILTYLLGERQVDPNARRALMYARRHARGEAVQTLIAHGATE